MAEPEKNEEKKKSDSGDLPTESLRVDPNRLFKWVIKETGNISYNNMPEELPDDPNVTRLINLEPEEREKWMNVLFGKPEDRITDFERLKLCVAGLMKDAEEGLSNEDVEGLLQNMHFLCELPHIARNLFNIGAEELVFKYCKHEAEEVREQAAWIFHTCSGNNPVFKERFLEANGMEQVFNLIGEEESWIVKKKYIGTLCNFCRQFPPGAQAFLDHGGLELLKNWLPLQNRQVFGKCIRTVIELLHSNCLTVEQIQSLGFNQWVPDCLQSSDYSLRSGTLEVLQLCTTRGFLDVVQEIPNINFNLNTSLSVDHGDDPELLQGLKDFVHMIKIKVVTKVVKKKTVTLEIVQNLELNEIIPSCLQSRDFDLRMDTLKFLLLCAIKGFSTVIQGIPNIETNLDLTFSMDFEDDEPEELEMLRKLVNQIKRNLPQN